MILSLLGCAAPVTPVSPPSAPVVHHASGARYTWSAIACFVGAPWTNALGDASRCKSFARDALGADDAQTVAALRGLDRDTVAVALRAVGESGGDVALVRATAEAAREAIAARDAAKRARAGEEVGPEDLVAKDALAKLYSMGAEGRVVAYVLAAEHLDAVRGLPPRMKIFAASPAFEVVFALPRPNNTFQPGDWLTYVSSAAIAAHHPPPIGSTHDRERAAFAGVAAGIADRLDASFKALDNGDGRAVADAYRKRLRAEIARTTSST